ncbi:type II secretion system protein J [Bdellovibrio sp. HCB337]|uniref:PulJ/GspJ family protein n=1 Tax=Bdellovibrio sp. HCB337 TaxID=3394358 RepID=UPI0039A60CCB
MNSKLAQRGYTLIEIILSLAVTSVLVLIVAQVSQDIIKDVQRNNLVAARDQVVATFRQSSGSINILRASLRAASNTQFRDCVCGTGAGCVSAQNYPFVLYENDGAGLPISTYFDANGLPCDKNQRSCLVEITTYFVAQCMPVLPSSDPQPPASCVGVPVEFIGVFYNVHQNPLTVDQGNVIKPVAGAVFTQANLLAPTGSGVCP